jgi:hypothetical protein
MSVRGFLFTMICAVIGLSSTAFAQDAENAAAPVPSTGKLVFTFTVTVSSTVPSHAVVVCTAFANINESGGQSIQQTAVGIATPSSGKATCTANMPYSWALATPSTDKVNLSYKVELIYGYQITASNGTAIVTTPVSGDKVSENLSSISVPANGATTNENVSATI